MPYYPDYNDIRKVSANKEQIVIIPQPEYSPTFLPMLILGIDMVKQKLFGRDDTSILLWRTGTSRKFTKCHLYWMKRN